ncbi:dTDP-4-dehydrorhamnose 3,5-epimerase [Achromobacter dolens]|uniref:dTDP-4-dehydrorhamnose 3,5-epimerase n=1 Tax=Achromobacter dolens TaxID=1287738 RepID=A0A6S7E6J7_9BURK|nr:dTDP-4-dehydrorhamnose 3,5-epimerase [Achromobacter dolens]CAB3649365.1 dTDP-4-dehydrorhamnose 3,5-epimerase [Achromobacter dolens]CAB3897983.1 dTDP-4-dehydrorhamnose 3,5-epimerase [Achromobacter dolens]CUI28708.1 dTDP-4-dehydrorhamnose 3%2C5-epimerase [Achromobacter dolens]
MLITSLTLPDVLLIQPAVHRDARGCFFETYRQAELDAAVGRPLRFVQDNQSESRRHVLRGLHYQTVDPQGKLLRVTEGEIYDVAVDVRQGSPTFGQWVAQRLSSDNRLQLWIPEGFAHGFLALSERAVVSYKATAYYQPAHQQCLLWNDPDLGVAWPLAAVAPLLSVNDQRGLPLARTPGIRIG